MKQLRYTYNNLIATPTPYLSLDLNLLKYTGIQLYFETLSTMLYASSAIFRHFSLPRSETCECQTGDLSKSSKDVLTVAPPSW